MLRLLSWMKRTFPDGSVQRQRLVDGKVVLRLRGGDATYEGDVETCRVQRLMHVALQYNIPFRPTWHFLEQAEDLDETVPHPARMYATSLARFETVYLGMTDFRDCQRIYAQVWEVEEAPRPVTTVTPHTVPLVRAVGFEQPERWWPRRVAKRKAAAKSAGGAEGLPDAEGMEAAEGDGGGDDPYGPEGTGADVGEPAGDVADLADALLHTCEAPLVSPPAPAEPPPDEPPLPAPSTPPLAPPLPPPPAPRVVVRGGNRSAPFTAPFAQLSRGKIIWYSSSGNFEAKCEGGACRALHLDEEEASRLRCCVNRGARPQREAQRGGHARLVAGARRRVFV